MAAPASWRVARWGQVLFDTLEVIPHRRKPEERRIMLNDIFRSARSQAPPHSAQCRPNPALARAEVEFLPSFVLPNYG